MDRYPTTYLYVLCGVSCGELPMNILQALTHVIRELYTGPMRSTKNLMRIDPTIATSRTRQYRIWNAMIQRCKSSKAISYKYYGKRGITYVPKWSSFFGFWEDMKLNYKNNLVLDRINNNKGYCKSNCRWTNWYVQNNNRRNNRRINYEGKTKTVAEWGRMFNINPNRIHTQIYRGWDVTKIMEKLFIHYLST